MILVQLGVVDAIAVFIAIAGATVVGAFILLCMIQCGCCGCMKSSVKKVSTCFFYGTGMTFGSIIIAYMVVTIVREILLLSSY